ncbi:MAG: response regulator [Elusimicrobia bacterium]|nr:response regulator [Elusimicrobiota bacterium]
MPSEPLRILLLDDDAMVRNVLARQIGRLGWGVVAVASAQEAYRAHRPGLFTALLADVDLGGGEDGIAVAQKLLEREPGLRVVMMSGEPGNAVRAQERGLGKLFNKPFDLGEIADLMGRLAREARAAHTSGWE